MTQAIQLCFSSTPQSYPVDMADKDAVSHFRKNNPHIIGNTIPKGTPYVVSHGNEASALEWRSKRPDLVCAFNQAQALSPQAQRNLADLSDLYGGDTLLAIANFYQDEIIPIVQNESVGAIGAATTAAETRLSEFGKAAKKLQTAYEKVRSAYKGKVPAKQLKMLEQIARNCQADFQLKFQAEIQKYIVKVKAGRRGTIYTNGQLGINRAKSGKTSRPIQISTTREFNNLRALERGSNLLGKGLLVVDAGMRTRNVHKDYQAGRDWQRRAVMETTGFGMGSAAGLYVGGKVISSALGIAMLATPVGWCFVIGTSIAAGYLASKAFDSLGKEGASIIYDYSKNNIWF